MKSGHLNNPSADFADRTISPFENSSMPDDAASFVDKRQGRD